MIHTLATLKIVGPVTVSLVRVADEHNGDVTEDYEVSCEHADCVLYGCTHLTSIEALVEAAEHAQTHGIVADDEIQALVAEYGVIHGIVARSPEPKEDR